jgi:putative nucleotidyltransferase with HDIG domain
MPSFEEALALMEAWTESASLRRHMRAVEVAMRAYARRYGEDEELWAIAGVLHDMDYEKYPEEHPYRAVEELRRLGYPEEVLEAIEGHVYGVDPENGIGMALYVADVSEPGRGVNEEIRELALAGRLKEAYRLAVRNKVHYLKAKKIPIHPRTLEVYHSL